MRKNPVQNIIVDTNEKALFCATDREVLRRHSGKRLQCQSAECMAWIA